MSDKRVYIETYGCQENVYDSTAIGELLGADGWVQVDAPGEADLVLMNTCAVRDNAEQRVLGRIGELQSLKKQHAGLKLGVVGCMAQRLGDALHAQKKAVDLVVGTDAYGRLPGIVEQVRRDGRPRFDLEADGQTTYVAPPQVDPLNNSHFISITRGCDYRCTFCIVPYTRGALRAKAPAQVVAEVERVVAQGGLEVTLLGQNATAYRHADASFAELLSAVAGVPGLRRVRFLTSHPTDFPEETLQAIAGHAEVSPWLHMPLQSGSDRVLRRMKRGYRMGSYMEVVERARELLPDLTLSTDMIVGFPGETEDDFRLTLDAMESIGYDSAFTFKYSERPGTPSSRLPDDVGEEVKAERLARLNATQQAVWERNSAALVGQEWVAAVEGPDRKGRGVRARTLNNRKVVVVDAGDARVGDELRVRVEGVHATTFLARSLGHHWRAPDVAA